MAILEGIRIQNYRALKDVTLGRTCDNAKVDPLPRLTAVIGANGTGKSSLLDALCFLGDCLKEGVQAACDKPHRGGFERLRTQGVEAPLQFDIRFRDGSDTPPINYALGIGSDSYGRPIVIHESLGMEWVNPQQGVWKGRVFTQWIDGGFLDLTDGRGLVWAGQDSTNGNPKMEVEMQDRQVLAVATFGTLASHPEIGKFREFLSSWYFSYFDPKLAREPSTAGADPHLDREGKNLAKYLQFIEVAHPGELNSILQRIAKKIPGLVDIKTSTSKNKQLFLEFYCEGYTEPFFQQDMSDGTLKLLAYLLLMEDPNPASLMGIEEPENGLHHQLLSLLATELKNFSHQKRGPQVLIATHAPNFVDALTPEEVWILSKGTDGYSSLTCAADIAQVRALFDEGIPMGSLWFSDHFGIGNP
jgi:predicted ATPase